MDFIYHIGEEYRYPNGTKRFRLVSCSGWIFKFACGHWCTDSVFIDLIRIKTGVQVFNELQLSLL